MNHLNKNKFYKNEDILSITVRIYIVYRLMKSYKLYIFFTESINIKIFFKYIDIFLPDIINYLTFIIFLAIIWYKSKKISKHLLPKIESIIFHKSYYNIVYIVIYIGALGFIIDIVQLIILVI
jgi:hypothetical protein